MDVTIKLTLTLKGRLKALFTGRVTLGLDLIRYVAARASAFQAEENE